MSDDANVKEPTGAVVVLGKRPSGDVPVGDAATRRNDGCAVGIRPEPEHDAEEVAKVPEVLDPEQRHT